MPVHCTRRAPLSDSIEQFNSVSKVPNIPVQMVTREDKVRVGRSEGLIQGWNRMHLTVVLVLDYAQAVQTCSDAGYTRLRYRSGGKKSWMANKINDRLLYSFKETYLSE